MRMTRTNDLKNILLEKNLKPSPARLRILDIFTKSHLPLDVDQLLHKLHGSTHLATVYRTLEKLVAASVLERVNFQEGKFRYEYMTSHHHHAVCQDCGNIEDVVDSSTEVSQIEERIKRESGFQVTKHYLELFGTCNKCQRLGSYAY